MGNKPARPGQQGASGAAATPHASDGRVGTRDSTKPTSGSSQASSVSGPVHSVTGKESDSSGPKAVTRRAVLDDFVLLKTVGKGSFGKVVMVRRKDDGRIYAMKVLKKEMVLRRRQYEHTLSERRILQNIHHPFIVSLHFAFQTEHKLYMVFDFFNGGELYHYLSEGGRFDEARARFYAAEIACALDYLHQRGIVYRDLKPENLILDKDGHIRITDFGLSKEGVEGDTITSICGTPEYLAPEILRKRPYGMAVDWWSLGTLLWEMIAGLPPFYDRNRQVMYRKILEAPLEPPNFMSPEAADLCAKMLVREPAARLGYNGAADIKTHPFFRGLDWTALEARAVPPPWTPRVTDEMDTRNIASEFTNEAPAVTPSPAGTRLRDLIGAEGGGGSPPGFDNFTYTHTYLDGTTYRVSLAEDEGEEELIREGLLREGDSSGAAGQGGGGHPAGVVGRTSSQGTGTGSDANASGLLDRSDGPEDSILGPMDSLRM